MLVGSPSCVTLTKTFRQYWIIYITNPTQPEHRQKKTKQLIVLIYGMETGCSFLVCFVFIARFLTWVMCPIPIPSPGSQVRHPGSIWFLLLFLPEKAWQVLVLIEILAEQDHSQRWRTRAQHPECPGGSALFAFQIRNTKLGTSLKKNPNNLHSFKRDQVCLLCPSLIYYSLNSF